MSFLSSSSKYAVEFLDAGFSYENQGSSFSLSHINLRVARGECVVLTGPSGCGKTTLTRMVNGLIPSVYPGTYAGEVRVFGRCMESWEMDELSCVVGSVFQNPRSQFFNLDTTSEIAFGCENMNLPREEIVRRIEATAAALHIEDLLERDIHVLSGGEKQLIALASVYAMGPDVFVLDEPTASLDIPSMRLLRSVLQRLKEAGKTLIVAEHRLWWIADICDRVVVMDKGHIIDDLFAAEFSRMSTNERQSLGLRAWDLLEVSAEAHRGAVQGSAQGAAQGAAQSALADAIAMHDVSARRVSRGRLVLKGCSLAAKEGRALVLVGPNGAGKTTLSRILAGISLVKAGTVELSGVPTSTRDRTGRVFLGMQESGYQLFSDTVSGELHLALESARRLGCERTLSGPEEDLIAQMLERFGLADLADRHPLSLSGGERQRLTIAAGVLQGSRVVVLDEPTSGLDLVSMRQVAQEVSQLKDEGICFVIVTHDFELACATSDELALLKDGAISETIPLDQDHLARARELMGISPERADAADEVDAVDTTPAIRTYASQ